MIMDDTTTPNSTLVSNTTVMAVEMARNCIPVRIIGLVSDTILAGSLIFSPYLAQMKSEMVTALVFLPK